MPDGCAASNTSVRSRPLQAPPLLGRRPPAGTRPAAGRRPRRKCSMCRQARAATARTRPRRPAAARERGARWPRAARRSGRARTGCRPRGSRARSTRRCSPAAARLPNLGAPCASPAEDPGVLAAAAELHGDDQRLLARGDARQPAGQHRVRRAVPRRDTRSTTCRGSRPRCVCTGAVDRSTCSCATYCSGLRLDARGEVAPRSSAVIVAGNSACCPKRGNAA